MSKMELEALAKSYSSLWKRVIAWDLDWSRERLWDCLGGRDGKQTWRNVEQNVIAWLKQHKIAK